MTRTAGVALAWLALAALPLVAACGQPEDRCASAREWYTKMSTRRSCTVHSDCAVAPTAHWQNDGLARPYDHCPSAVRASEAMGVELSVDNLDDLHCAETTPALPATCHGHPGRAECVRGVCTLLY